MEQTLIICKPDALQRDLVGEVIGRFEKKGLKIVGMKMDELNDLKLDEHYDFLKDKPFFGDLKNYMKSFLLILIVLEGPEVVEAVRLVVGSTRGVEADAGTIRGDLALTNHNLVHASDSVDNAVKEISRFFHKDELFSYKKVGDNIVFED